MYGYGYRYNSGLVLGSGGGAPFINTYSLDFDGINDYLNLGDSDDFSFGNGTTDSPFSISAWIKMDSTSGFRIFNKSLGATSEYQFATSGSGKLQLFIFNSTSNFIYRARVYNTVLNTGQWYHVAATYNGVGGSNAQDGIKIYVDGVRVDDSSVSGGTYVAMGNTTAPAYIGKLDSSYANGSIDEVSVFDTAIDITDVWDGSGKPTDLTDLSPIAWYRMGDNGSYKSPQWLIPNNSNKDKVSNYSFAFDGMDDNIETTSKIIGSDITLSGWVNFNGGSYTSSVAQFPMSITPSNTGAPNETIGRFFKVGVNMRISIQCFDQNGANYSTYTVPGLNFEGAGWNHVCWTYNVTTRHIYVYINGVAQNWLNFSGSVTTPYLTAISGRLYESDLTIGRQKPTTPTGTYLGLVDEVSTYSRILTQEEITSISAAPTDLTSLSPYGWWRMGEEATFSGGVWTVPDAVGSNDGASVNMNFLDRIGEAPNSTGNALSFNMDSGDRLEDTP